jgi:hypothetical protein
MPRGRTCLSVAFLWISFTGHLAESSPKTGGAFARISCEGGGELRKKKGSLRQVRWIPFLFFYLPSKERFVMFHLATANLPAAFGLPFSNSTML